MGGAVVSDGATALRNGRAAATWDERSGCYGQFAGL